MEPTVRQKEVNDMFNSGQFNEIAIGYGKLALKQMGVLTGSELAQFERAMQRAFDLYDAEQARQEFYRFEG